MRFTTLEGGCFVCLTHRLNQDGYLRKRFRDGIEMFHRFIWRAHNGEIPDGYEVDHICKNRACCNPDHLEAVPREDHLVETNSSRTLGDTILVAGVGRNRKSWVNSRR
ncbi:HNH endonuclease signature motif containing protein [Xanthobacter wiegelii]|uniref:HNH endonuclease signature motif containing protein n=1 Tax=Xanthobacter wiegelii TaxID=3119913 RepID=UPI00372C7F34